MKEQTRMEIVKEFRIHEKDTSSVDVQIGILTEQIILLDESLGRQFTKEKRLKLLRCLNERRRFLTYLSQTDEVRHHAVIAKMKRMEPRKY